MNQKIRQQLAPNCIKFKLPHVEEAIKHKFFDCLDTSEFRISDTETYINIPTIFLGKEVVFQKNVSINRTVYPYAVALNKKYLRIHNEDLELWSTFAELVEGKAAEPMISIGGDPLLYNNKTKNFTCGCKTINLNLAERIFKFLGEHLDYDIC